MKRQELLQRCSDLLARFASEVKVQNAMGLFDINKVAEDFLIPILAIAFGCPTLRNQNRIRTNFPAIDLGCESSRISIQITSDSSSGKVCETLEKFEAHGLGSDFDCLYVYVVTERQRSYTSVKLAETAKRLSIDFDSSSHILDFHDLAKKIGELDNKQIEQITNHLEAEYRKADAALKFRANLDAFLEVSQRKIEDEKRTKKYIPSIFVETSKTKDEVRYFANPMFFYRKIDDDLGRIDLSGLNDLLGLAKIEPLADNLSAVARLKEPTSLPELQKRFTEQANALKVCQDHVSPFSWRGERAERYEPVDYLTGYWTVFRIGIESAGTGVYSALEKIGKKIEIARAKIFLVTGMAGQGKTNFVCDLIENQFRAFEVPAIFIPGRSLNDYPGPNRVLSYIKNNRYSPDVENFHGLLSLLNNVADECQKPFIIVIDGINEVTDLGGFAGELRVLLEAACQYEFVKIVLTCRDEFFEHKFAEVFEPQFSDYLYRVRNLSGGMSENNKSRMLRAYLRHFKIKTKLSQAAAEFLKNDLILLRIFSEIHEGNDIGYVSDIYKGEIFEGYLIKKIEQFPIASRQKARNSLYKICSRMLAAGEFSQISLDGFDEPERQIIERLIGEDIILRREVPSAGLASLGVENISFTYDELRDFMLAHYCIEELAGSQSAQVKQLFDKIPMWPVYEGFFRYVYVLARKRKCEEVKAICEASPDFRTHFLNNLSLLSADIQTLEDVRRIEEVLNDGSLSKRDLSKVAWFLFRKRDVSEVLNIGILLNHVGKLNDEGATRFMKAMFSPRSEFQDGDWQGSVSDLLNSFNDLTTAQKKGLGVPALALALHFVPYARWEEREITLNFFSEFRQTQEIRDALDACEGAASTRVQNCLREIADERMRA